MTPWEQILLSRPDIRATHPNRGDPFSVTRGTTRLQPLGWAALIVGVTLVLAGTVGLYQWFVS